jgi:membrane protease YdiL (CAAX protease family)
MRPVRSLIIFLAVVFLGGGLLAPWLFWLAQSLSHVFPTLAKNPFHRFVNRSLLGVALIGLWPFLRNLGVRSASDVGIVQPAGQWRRLLGGFALGFGSLACVALIVLAAGARKINADLASVELARKLLSITATAAIVAVLEELLFRGALFGALRRAWHWLFALAVSSAVYALVHFMESAKLSGPVDWLSGLELLPRMLHGFTNWREVTPGFFNLTLAGLLLGIGYHRTGNLYFSIGLHAGWIFWLKAHGMLTLEVPGKALWFWGSSRLIDGWLAFFVLALLLVVVLRLFRPRGGHLRYEDICF